MVEVSAGKGLLTLEWDCMKGHNCNALTWDLLHPDSASKGDNGDGMVQRE